MINDGKKDFFRDSEGNIDAKRLSDYGKNQLKLLQGATLGFTDKKIIIKGNKMIDETGTVFQIINNDRLINKIEFRIING